MNRPLTDLTELLSSLRPVLSPGVYVFCTLPFNAPVPDAAIAMFREAEGLSIILPEETAAGLNFDVLYRARWITLTVNSDLAAVGLTAAVSNALASRGISCNVVAAAQHDHLFVPVNRADEALAALLELQTDR